MKWLKKLFSPRTASTVAAVASTLPASGSANIPATSSDPAKDPNMIRVYDAYGREMFITKQA